MDINNLKSIVQNLVASSKGILAADESFGTIKKRFDAISLESTEENRLAYRQMLFTTPGIEQYLSGVILFDETIRQSLDGISVSKYLESKGIVPGIKVDKGVVDLPNFPQENITEGLEGLEQRLEEYKSLGAKFTKWRAVIIIGESIPTGECIRENAKRLARYAFICQSKGLVPIIESDVVRDGAHDLERCKQVTRQVLKAIFEEVSAHNVTFEGLILKTSMVTTGQNNPHQASPEEVARATIDALLETVPKEVPGVVFLSGGQSPDMATDNLHAINKIGGPWELSFSFARALQDEVLTTWAGKEENVQVAQEAFLNRAKKVSVARQGKLLPDSRFWE